MRRRVLMALAQDVPLDPQEPLKHYTSNTNDGYSGGRGVVFTANQNFQVFGADLWTKSTGGLNATFELWNIVTTEGNVLNGATLVGSFNALLQGDIGFHGGDFAAPLNVVEDEHYLLRVHYSEAADENWFFDFDPVHFGHDPVDIGILTILNGTQGGNTANFVMPFMQITIPSPGALALLGLAGLAAARRRRH